MKAALWLVTAAILLAACAAAEECRRPQELGVLAPVQAEAQVVVPKDGLWQAPEASFVCSESIFVQPEHGPPLVRREREPRLGQFSYRFDGVIVFSAADAGRHLVVRYEFQPRRVALLEAASPGDNADARSLLRQSLAETLGKRGCVVVPAQEVRDAAAALALEAISPRALPPAEKLAALAQKVSAAYVLVPGIGLRGQGRPDEFDTGIPIPRDQANRAPEPFFAIPGEREDRESRSPLGEDPTLLLPITRYRLYGAVRLIVVDGATGTVVTDGTKSDFQRVRPRRFSPALRSLVQSLAAQVVDAWRGAAR